MLIRDAAASDMGALAQIYFDGVRIGAAGAYTEDELAAWAPHLPPTADWAERLSGLMTLVAYDAGQVQGFMSLRQSDGYLDFAFVRPDQRGTGIAARIYAVLENRARAEGIALLHTQASHLAKPFFERAGWSTQRPNIVSRAGQNIANFIMEKRLT